MGAPDHCELSTYGELIEILTNLRFLVREKRRRERLSQRAACREAGVHETLIHRLEVGDSISTEHVVTLLRWLGGSS